ncbi:glycoside hydrolase [Kordia sp. TARA_039_SRF]|nr:glycoside hydrolase [Kordia sp. TARA_039_SRF]
MKALQEKAVKVLEKNWKDSFSIPCEGLYPFQWNWDSGFIAIGLAHVDMEKAIQEMETLLNGQWDNGFLPHIIFHTETDTYFPGADFHCSYLHPAASKKYKSTGMTQPPVAGFALHEMYKNSKHQKNTLSRIAPLLDKVYKNHQYFYNHRDIHNEGLVYIYHNWESGTDNSPLWDDIFSTMESPDFTFERRDTTHVDASQRPSKKEYDHYLNIIEIAKEHNYNDEKIAQFSPFLVQDPLFNTMLIQSNASLIEMYKIIGNNEDKIQQLEAWQQKSIPSFNKKLFNKELGAYIHYDLRNEKPLNYISSSSFTPLFANIPDKEKADILVNTMMEKFGNDHQYLCASFDPTSDLYNPKKYWRGPVWINVNWIIYNGLKKYGYTTIAERVKNDSIALVEKFGFYEYFDARKNEAETGYGGNNFSWTAALLIDMLNDN